MGAGLELRRAIRRGDHTWLTTGLAAGFVQANLVVLPARHASDFVRFCARNPAACPVLGSSEAGIPAIPALGQDMDLRTDLPGYLVHRTGRAPEAVADISALWRDDLVAVAIGCWFSMEGALARAGVRMRHLELGLQGPIFKTTVQAVGVGRFNGPLVVSMRPFAMESLGTVWQTTRRFQGVHGAPIHMGDPSTLGIADLREPDFGERLDPLPGEVPVYWPCGLTAMVALENAGLDFFITHSPGKMLVTDCLNASLEAPAFASRYSLLERESALP